MKRIVCFTLDVEPDYGQDHIDNIELVEELIEESTFLDLISSPIEFKLTAFVVGSILEKNPEIVDRLIEFDAEVELHSYSHKMYRERRPDIVRGLDIYREIVGRLPYGYRAPQGAISLEEIEVLDSYGVLFDSSVFPFFRLGQYSFFHAPQTPYLIRNSSVVEFPIASIPHLRLPISLSYMMLFGRSIYERLFRTFGLPEILVFDFHLHDLTPSKAYNDLSKFWQIIYGRIYKQNPIEQFQNFVSYLRNLNYTFMNMRELYNYIRKNKFNEFLKTSAFG
ncbi:MAG: putative xylanase/chitin deacetylase [Candidatus Thorarchaeota archaeon]|nr:MAG: putative xylanase/chitin deacetylase [Candidatus Thorarchaeota archaeon]